VHHHPRSDGTKQDEKSKVEKKERLKKHGGSNFLNMSRFVSFTLLYQHLHSEP